MDNYMINLLIDHLYEALEEFEVAYNEADFSGPLSATIGEDLHAALQDHAEFYMEGVGSLGELLSRGHLITSRVALIPVDAADFLKDLRLATEILKEVE